jgi:hypothetical protein
MENIIWKTRKLTWTSALGRIHSLSAQHLHPETGPTPHLILLHSLLPPFPFIRSLPLSPCQVAPLCQLSLLGRNRLAHSNLAGDRGGCLQPPRILWPWLYLCATSARWPTSCIHEAWVAWGSNLWAQDWSSEGVIIATWSEVEICSEIFIFKSCFEFIYRSCELLL